MISRTVAPDGAADANANAAVTSPNQPPRQRIMLFQAIILAVMLAFSFATMEVVLRAFPGIMSLAVISQMQPGTRAEIAGRLGLPTRNNKKATPAKKRLYPGTTIYQAFPDEFMMQFNEPADRALGAVDSVRIDGKGFCNDPAKAQRGRADILFAGDSFTFCTSVDPADTAAARVEQMTGLATYNLGIGGTGPDTHLDLLMRHAGAFSPSVAVMSIYEGNDLRDLVNRRRFLETGKDPRRADAVQRPSWSYAAEFINANVKLLRQQWKKDSAGKNKVNFRYSAKVDDAVVAMNIANKDYDEVKTARALAEGKVSLDEFRQPLVDYVAWAKRSDIRPLLLYIPSMYTAHEGSVTFEDRQVGETVTAFSKAQRKWLAENAAAIGYEYLDTTPLFQQATGRGELTHFPGNVHLTPAGHQIVARAVIGMTSR